MRTPALGKASPHLGADPCLGEVEAGEAFLLPTWRPEEAGVAVAKLLPYLAGEGVDGEARPLLLEAVGVGTPYLEEGVAGVAYHLRHSSL